ncbi:hypothetical protein ACWIGI_15770 [Nocardia sp. NPDC055321]
MIFDDEDDGYSGLEEFEFERPRSWLQFADGTWEPVWADGSVGDPEMVSNLVEAVCGDEPACRVIDLGQWQLTR